MTIGNLNPADFRLACCHCGSKSRLSQVAHRNDKNRINGYIFLCDTCLPIVAGNYTVEIKPMERILAAVPAKTE